MIAHRRARKFLSLFLLLGFFVACLAASATAAPLIVNEFNAVNGSGYLNGGNAGTDGDGNSIDPPSDPTFGRVAGNGGDWIEFVVVGDHLDIRGWSLVICERPAAVLECDDTLTFSNHLVWSDLRAGTILTVSEDQPTDLSFNIGSNDWTLNVQASNSGDGTYITASNFPVSEKDWQVTILDDQSQVVFGPLGEHVPIDIAVGCSPPQDNLNSGETFRLEQAPSALIDPCLISRNDYEDGVISTFAAPNQWNSGTATQNFSYLRELLPFPDIDGDSIPDDGDFSGVAGDNPCTGGNTVGCDDNCAGIQNSGQQDTGGPGGSDGQGDVCQCGDPTGDSLVTSLDLDELRQLHVGQISELTVAERCSVHSDGQCTLADLVVLDRTLSDPAKSPGLAPTCQEADVAADISELLYDPERLVKVDIRIDQASWDTLRVQQNDLIPTFSSLDCGAAAVYPDTSWPDPYTFFPSEVTVDGETLTNVAIRKKGFQGSLSETKPSFKVKFDHYVGGQQVADVDRLTLNNNNQDPSQVNSCLSYKLMRDAGVPAPRCNFAHVTVTLTDDESVVVDSIYSNVDSIKDPFLRRNFGSDAGRLYEGTLSDFWTGSFRNTFEPKSQEAADDTSEIDALTAVLMDGGLSDAARLAAIEGLVAVDEFLTFWAAEGMVGHWDGYADDQNNFWFYVDPADGLMHFIPWGPDDTFGRGNTLRDGDENHADAIVPRAALTRRLYEIPSTKALYLARLQSHMNNVFVEAEVLAEIDRMEAIITPVMGNLTVPLNQVRTWVSDHGPHVQAEINSPPLGYSGQTNHFCFFNP